VPLDGLLLAPDPASAGRRFTDYGTSSVTFPNAVQCFDSDLLPRSCA
jgi:hypothetical protein